MGTEFVMHANDAAKTSMIQGPGIMETDFEGSPNLGPMREIYYERLSNMEQSECKQSNCF